MMIIISKTINMISSYHHIALKTQHILYFWKGRDFRIPNDILIRLTRITILVRFTKITRITRFFTDFSSIFFTDFCTGFSLTFPPSFFYRFYLHYPCILFKFQFCPSLFICPVFIAELSPVYCCLVPNLFGR